MRTKEEYLNLLNETVEYYYTNERAFNKNGSCQYYGEYGQLCAVGRCLIEPEGFVDIEIPVRQIDNFEYELKAGYTGFKMEFWTMLQTLHDSHTFWVENTLSIKGEKYKEVIKKWINEN